MWGALIAALCHLTLAPLWCEPSKSAESGWCACCATHGAVTTSEGSDSEGDAARAVERPTRSANAPG